MFTWLARFIERHPNLHRLSLLVWRLLPPRLAGFLKGLLARKWLVGAVAVMIDESTSPLEVLLVELPKNPDPTGWIFTFAARLVTDLQHCDTA